MTKFKFETLLPYSLKLRPGSVITVNHECLTGSFIHISRQQSNLASGSQLAPSGYVAGDRYGVFYKSRVAIVLDDAAIAYVLSLESSEVRRLWADPVQYVALLFGSPAATLTGRVIAILNHALALYRVTCEEWHVAPVAPKDLGSWRTLRLEGGGERVLQTLDLTHQTLVGDADISTQQMHLLQFSADKGGRFPPLLILEADIHDKITQADFLAASILIALLSEEAIKSHAIQFLVIRDGLTYLDARSKLKKSNGYIFGIADLVDRPRQKGNLCFVEEISGWRPFEEPEYDSWSTDVRGLRNEVLHGGPQDMTPDQINSAWIASCSFIRLSYQRFIERLLKHGCDLNETDSYKFYNPISDVPGANGMFGKYNDISV